MLRKLLIVNGDDFGMCPAVNRGIMQSHEHGILTSASLMVRLGGAEEAAEYSKLHSDLSVGLHIDLGEWVLTETGWVARYEVVDLADANAVSMEIERQLHLFEHLVGRPPTHLDSHQHVHRQEVVREIALGKARNLSIPLRGVETHIEYCGAFFAQDKHGVSDVSRISPRALVRILQNLHSGVTELACHPAAEKSRSAYDHERIIELRTLCDPEVRDTLLEFNVELCSFHTFGILK